MATITAGMDEETLELYKGFSTTKVGPGTDPDMYASASYAAKKAHDLKLGMLARVIYGGAEHDIQPLILPMKVETAYNTILAYNLNYCPIQMREDIISFILESNQNRIRSQQQIIIDYQGLKRAIPPSQYIVRRYKQVLLTPREHYELLGWGKVVRNSGTQWSSHYRKFMN